MTKRALKTLVKDLVTRSTAVLSDVADASSKHLQFVGEQYVSLGIVLDEYADLASAHSLGDWREWARERFAASNGVRVSVDTLYRIRNAGTVARVCDGFDLDGVTYLALVPFYRALAAAKTDDEKEQARTLVRTLVQQGIESADGLTVSVAENLTSEIAPTRGKGAGNAKTTAANRKAAKGRKAAKAATAATAAPAITAEDSASREACANAVARVLKPYGDEDLPQVRAIMLATVKLCESHNPSTVAAIVKGYRRSS